MNFFVPFLVYSCLGWVMDTAYRSWSAKRWAPGGAFHPLPVTPVYGFGALLVLSADPFVRPSPVLLEFFAFGVGLALFEFFSGLFSEAVFRRRLWNYGHVRGWFRGYTDVWHVLIWGTLALLLTRVIHPFFVERFLLAS